jgi:hypothetical protein
MPSLSSTGTLHYCSLDHSLPHTKLMTDASYCYCGEQLTSRGADHGELGCTWAPTGREIFCPEHLEARDKECAGGVRRPRSAGARGKPADFGPSLTRRPKGFLHPDARVAYNANPPSQPRTNHASSVVIGVVLAPLDGARCRAAWYREHVADEHPHRDYVVIFTLALFSRCDDKICAVAPAAVCLAYIYAAYIAYIIYAAYIA